MEVHIPDDDNNIGFLSDANLLKLHHYAGGLLSMRSRADSKVYVRNRNAEVPEENIGHPFVVMLPGVDKNALQIGRFLHLVHERSDLHEVRPGAHDVQYFHGTIPLHIVFRTEIQMSKLVLGLLLFTAQLSGPGSTLPQILHPEFKVAGPAGPMRAGQPGEVTVSFNLLKGYAINHKPPISLKLTKISGVTLMQNGFCDTDGRSQIERRILRRSALDQSARHGGEGRKV